MIRNILDLEQDQTRNENKDDESESTHTPLPLRKRWSSDTTQHPTQLEQKEPTSISFLSNNTIPEDSSDDVSENKDEKTNSIDLIVQSDSQEPTKIDWDFAPRAHKTSGNNDEQISDISGNSQVEEDSIQNTVESTHMEQISTKDSQSTPSDHQQISKSVSSEDKIDMNLFSALPRRAKSSLNYKEDEDYNYDEDVKSKKRREEKAGKSSKKSGKINDPQAVKLYCICRQPDVPGKFMIACDSCREWYHGDCIGLSEEKASRIKKYICESCRAQEALLREEEMKIMEEERRNKCSFLDCENRSRADSKYCSDECGVKMAKERLKEKNERIYRNICKKKRRIWKNSSTDDRKNVPTEDKMDIDDKKDDGKIGESNFTIAASDIDNLLLLEELEKKKQQTAKELEEIEKKTRDLEAFLEAAHKWTVSTEVLTSELKDAEKRGSALDLIDCVTCGQPISFKHYNQHIEQCLSKRGIVTLNEFLPIPRKNQACGCPTSEFVNGHCERLKRTCIKHLNWESLRRLHLQQDEIRLNLIFEQLLEEEKLVQARISRREKVQNQNNRTLEESKLSDHVSTETIVM